MAILVEIILWLAFNTAIDSVFVSIGKYRNPDLISKGVNTPECGLGYKPIVHQLVYKEECFARKFQNKTVHYLGMGVHEVVKKRVFGGVDAKYGEAPFAGLLKTSIWWGARSGYCTASLIAHNWLITSAHCYKQYSVSTRKLFIGDIDVKGYDIQQFEIPDKNWHLHPQIHEEVNKKYGYYDIALIKLDKKLDQKIGKGGEFLINTICLPGFSEYNLMSVENSTFFGFGAHKSESDLFSGVKPVMPGVLQRGDITLIPMVFCSEGNMLCTLANASEPKSCGGDSGGPLVQYLDEQRTRAVLVGVTRGHVQPNGTSSIECSEIIEYTKWVPVSKFMPWILEIISNYTDN